MKTIEFYNILDNTLVDKILKKQSVNNEEHTCTCINMQFFLLV